MQRNYCSPLLRRSPKGLRRGPSSSEPYQPSSSPPARMLLPAEHSPLGSQHFGEHCHTSQRAQNTWASRRTGSLALGPRPPGQVEPRFKLSVQLRDSHASHGVGKGGKAPTFYTLGGVDCGVLASSSDFPFADLLLHIGLLWELGLDLFSFLSSHWILSCTTSVEGHSTRLPCAELGPYLSKSAVAQEAAGLLLSSSLSDEILFQPNAGKHFILFVLGFVFP